MIDMLAHIGVKKGENYKVESLLDIMNTTGVERCMICSQLETIDNEYIYECCKKYPDRTLGFAVINPWDVDGEEQLERCFKDYHFHGLKMNAIRFGYSADRHSVLDPYFELCRKYKKCVVVHGQSDMFSIPDKWAEMAKSFPDVPVILYHMGVPLMYEIAGPEKILFSSDAPFGDQAQEIEKVRYICDHTEHLEMMLGKNAKQMLGL